MSGGGPLQGVRVIELSTVLMAPFAAQMMAELGADVIKVEPPDGDTLRDIGARGDARVGPLFIHANRGKRSVTLDLKQPKAREVMLRLLVGADCLIYNVRPAAMERLGLSYEAVSAVNPGIVYAGLFGFDQRGPYAARPAYDDLIQGACAVPWLGHRAGAEVPRYAPVAIADRYCGQAGLAAVLAALFHRQRTGEGQRLDVPMYETFAHMVLSDHLYGRTLAPDGEPGYERLLATARRPYATLDGYVCLMVYNDRQWRQFFNAIGEPELSDDSRLADIAVRTRNVDFAYGLLADRMLRRSTADWMALLEAADIPVMPYHSLESLLEDPQIVASGLVRPVPDPEQGVTLALATPSQWSRTPPQSGLPAPRLGQHTHEVLREAGCSEAEITGLEQAMPAPRRRAADMAP